MLDCQRPFFSAATSCGILRSAQIISPQVSSAVPYDGRDACPDDTITPRRVQASISICGHGPFWLMIFSLGSFRRSAAGTGVRSRIRTRAPVFLRREASVLTCLVWSFHTLTEWPASLEKLARVGTMFW